MNRPDSAGFRRRRTGWLVGLAALVTVVPAPAMAAAAPPPPTDLHVQEGEGWRADRHFDVRWTNVAADLPIAAVHYRVRDPEGGVEVGPTRLGWPAEHETISVWGDGAHTAEVWLEDSAGRQGPADTVKLRLDTHRPDGVAPLPPAGWISRTEIPYAIRIAHPPGPPPVSGIRGYAISIDRTTAAEPCAGADLCTDAETDLRGGAGDDALLVDGLPEGTSYVHALAVSGSQTRSETAGSATIRVDEVDPVTRLLGAPAGWTNRAVRLEARASDSASGMAPSGDGTPFTAIRVDGEPPHTSPGATATATLIASGVHTVAYYARDAAGNVDDGADSNGQANRPPATAAVRIDREPPLVVFIGSVDPAEPELIEARVSDGLAGPDPDRGEIAVRRAGSDEPFRALPTAVADESLVARWHSDEYPLGTYEFRATGFDRAGNAGVGTRLASGAPMVLPNPLKSRAILVAGFGLRALQAERQVGYGRSTLFGGRLTATSDAELGGRTVNVVERFAPGAELPRRTTAVATGPDGSFSLRLPAGADREVFAVFGGTGTATGTSSRPLRLGVRSGVSLAASAATAGVGGAPLVFRGAVASAPGELPADGARVQLQFRVAGLDWTEFRTVQTNRRGRFRYAYRFSDDDSRGVRFQFRAFVPAQSGWPYEPAGSPPVAVRGR